MTDTTQLIISTKAAIEKLAAHLEAVMASLEDKEEKKVKRLDRDSKCACCGHSMKAGEEFSWKQITVNSRHAGNGTVTGVKTRYSPQHARLADCEAAKMAAKMGVGVTIEEAVLEQVAVLEENLNKLKRQQAHTTDPELLSVAQRSVDLADKELQQAKEKWEHILSRA